MGGWAILATASGLVARMVSVLVQTLVWSSESGDDWMIGWYPGWESNPHEEKSPEDFKSSASAIPPPGRSPYKSNEHRDLLQWRGGADLSPSMLKSARGAAKLSVGNPAHIAILELGGSG